MEVWTADGRVDGDGVDGGDVGGDSSLSGLEMMEMRMVVDSTSSSFLFFSKLWPDPGGGNEMVEDGRG